MQIVRDLDSDVYGVRRTLPPIRCHAHGPTVGAFRHARDQSVFAGQCQACFRIAKVHHGTCLRARYEAAPVDGHLPARNRGCRRNSFNVRNAVLFSRGTEAEFHA